MTRGGFRAVSFNIHHAAGKDRVVDLSRTARVIESLQPDLVALQELDVGAGRSGGADQPAELAERLGMHIHFVPTVAFARGKYGIALAATDGFEATSEQLPRIAHEEPRAAIRARWRGIDVIATHLSRSRRARNEQTRRLAELAAAAGDPVIVLGDMNQPRADLAPLLEVGLRMVKPKTSILHPVRRRWSVDHILVSPGVTVRDARTVPTDASDHPAVFADITLG